MSQAYRAASDFASRGLEQAAQSLENRRNRNALSQASQEYVNGNVAGARNALAPTGNLSAIMDIDRGEAAKTSAQTEAAETQRQRQRETILQAASGLLQVPAAQRGQVYRTRVMPTLASLGMDDVLGQVTDDQLSDQELRSLIVGLGGEVAAPQTFNTRDGVIERDPYTGDYRQGYAVTPDPLEAELMQARIDATRAQVGQRQAAAAKSRRGPAPRGGGRSGGGGSAPAQSSSAGRPWERSW